MPNQNSPETDIPSADLTSSPSDVNDFISEDVRVPDLKEGVSVNEERERTLKEKGFALLERIKNDERFFIELCLSVLDRRTGVIVPFKFNRVQEYYEKKKTNFDIILKARKLGMSSRIIAGDIWACAFKKNQHAVMLSYDKAETLKMIETRIKPMINSSKVDLGAVLYKDSVLFPNTNSRYYVGTAGTKKFGRGSDITRFHLTEGAFYESPDVITSVEEGCLEGAVGRIETTAQGMNFFKKMWDRAVRGESKYNPVFLAWYLDENYRVSGARLTNLGEEENKLIKAFNLDFEQLAWRREKIKGMSDPELFNQEYPSTPELAFLTSGRMAFDWTALVKHEQRCSVPKWRGFIEDNGETFSFKPDEKGSLSVWDHPRKKNKYIIGADIAEGIKDGAYSAAFVLNINENFQAAEWHGHIPPDRFADVLIRLSKYYNDALVVPEAWPGVGGITTQKMMDEGFRNIWRRESRGHRNGDQLFGWETTGRTRPKMLHALLEAIRDFKLSIHSTPLLDEMKSMVYDVGGDIYPQAGCYSDRVFACGIAWSVAQMVSDGQHIGTPRLREIENLKSKKGGDRFHGPIYGRREE